MLEHVLSRQYKPIEVPDALLSCRRVQPFVLAYEEWPLLFVQHCPVLIFLNAAHDGSERNELEEYCQSEGN